MRKRIVSILLAGTLLSGTAALFSACNNGSGGHFKTADSIDRGAILQAFSWDFKTLKNSMADIAAAGFTSVQTSPINACLEGEGGGKELYGDGKWYYHYQPTDFKIGNYQLGTRDEFKEMCDEADKYSIKVIVDVIANHTTPQLSAVSEDLVKAGGGSFETLFHKNNDKDLTDYGNRLLCTTSKMGGLPDINTERPSFQDYFISYINDCIACGADGFRYDTAKHIGLPDDPKEDDGFKNNFWERVTTEVDNADKLFIYGEVLQGDNDRIADYIEAIGHTTSSVYGSKIRGAIKNNIVNTASVSEYWLGKAPLQMVTWVESHDNYINDGTWLEMTSDQVILGWSIIASRKDGTPLFFSRPYGSSADSEWGMNRIGPQGDDMYKDSRVKAVNFFRTAMAGEDENLFNPNLDDTAVVIERGTKGAVIVNTKDALNIDFETNLADGTYVDRVDGKTEYTVKDGKMSCSAPLAENSVAVLYNDGYQAYTPCAEVGVADGTVFAVEDASSTKLKLTLGNAENGTYSLNGGEEKSYSDGDEITVDKPADGNVATVELRAENADKVPTYERVEITFRENYEIKKGTKVYFEKPADWFDEVYAYYYNVYGDDNDVWPGEPMTKEKDGRYSYTFTMDFTSPMIIFNDGEDPASQQYPADKGLQVEADKTYKVE